MIDLSLAREILITSNREVKMTDKDRLSFLIRKSQRLLSTWVVRRDVAERGMVQFANKDKTLEKAFIGLYATAIVGVENILKRLKLLRDLQYVMFWKSLVMVH